MKAVIFPQMWQPCGYIAHDVEWCKSSKKTLCIRLQHFSCR